MILVPLWLDLALLLWLAAAHGIIAWLCRERFAAFVWAGAAALMFVVVAVATFDKFR